MIKIGELVMILDLHRQGLSVSAIARQLGVDRKTVRTYIAKGLEAPSYKKRAGAGDRRSLRALFARAFGDLSRPDRSYAYGERSRSAAFAGGYSVVRDRARDLLPHPRRRI